VFVRWQNLEVGNETERPLPRLGADAVVRTFDAPEALDIRFHEVRAKSALNRVPKSSRMPFQWTINPYRGCSHACRFCMHGDTQILMGDGRTKRLADISVGDVVYGTQRRGRYRRYRKTLVSAHWSSVKRGYRVTLEDGTTLIASGDHRFLTKVRGWKYVTGAEQGMLRRPHLTTNDRLLGVGRFATAPAKSIEYRQGYLCGMIRGDGCLQSNPDDHPRSGQARHLRLALVDGEALRRSEAYLTDLGVRTAEFVFQAATGARREVNAVRAAMRDGAYAVDDVIRWPTQPGCDWFRGFLAGIYDAEGGFTGSLRIANKDPEIIAWITRCLRHFNFRFVCEPNENGMTTVRVLGGLKEQLRFFHTTDPAISRKRSIDGIAIKSDARLGIVSIEPLGIDLRMYDITTGTGDFIANGVVSHNCFARPTHTYLDLNADRDFEREIVVKVNVPELARAELSRPSWKREHVALGTNTDPYQWVESRYKLVPGIWEALLDTDTPCSLVTKSPLALRDIDVLSELAAGPGVSVYFSVPTLDEKVWRQTEPHTPSPRARLEAVRKMNEAGVPSGILVAPLIPGVNDDPQQVGEIMRIAAENGAISMAHVPLHLRREVKGIWFDWLRTYRPDLLPRYEELYGRGAYVPGEERKRLQQVVDGVRPKTRPRRPRPRPGTGRGRQRATKAPAPMPAQRQESLF
jgi:DNA repair photolyase